MVSDPLKDILITGATGFIGSALYKELNNRGLRVWGISRSETDDKNIIKCDLNSYDSTLKALSLIRECSFIVHTAAIAHDVNNDNCIKENTAMTENLIRVMDTKKTRFIFLSSVAVYGEDGKAQPISIDAQLNPYTKYGQSKVICEEIVKKLGIGNYHILRLTPVFDESNLADMKKRIYLPFQSKIKLKIIPSPKYSLCHINTVINTIIKLLNETYDDTPIFNVSDAVTYDQNTLLKRFDGMEIPCFVKIIEPLYYSSFLLPRKIGYPLRCNYLKLFKDNVYI